MKKVIHILPSIYSIDSRVINETKYLTKYYDVTVICYQNNENDKNNYGLHLIEIKPTKFKFFNLIINAIKFCKLNDVKLIHCHDFQGLIIGHIINTYFFSKYTLIYDSHELWSEAIYKKNKKNLVFRKIAIKIEKFIAKKVRNIITVSNSIKDYQTSYFNSNNIEVVRNIPSYMEKVESNYLREHFSISSERKILIYQGLISEARGVFDLYNNFNNCEESQNYSLVYLGYGPDIDILKELVKNNDNVFIHDKVKQNQISKITCSADIGIHPLQNTCLNHEYALPNKLFEYLNSGLVLITTELTEMKNELDQNKIGFCYSNSLELNEILKKLRLDKSLYDSILANVSHYNLNNNYESEMEILEEYYLKLLT